MILTILINHFTFCTASNDDSPTISTPENTMSDTNNVFFLADDREPEDIPPREFGRCPSGKWHACCKKRRAKKKKCDFYSIIVNDCEEWQCCASEFSENIHEYPEVDTDTCEPLPAYEPIPYNIPNPAPTDIPQSPPPKPAPEFFCPFPRVPPSI